MRSIQGKETVLESCADLLSDESNLSGAWCTGAYWPESTEEAAEVISSCAEKGIPMTLSGGLTGIAGGALPRGGVVISSSAIQGMEMVKDNRLRAGAGVTIADIRDFTLEKTPGLFYPPDPTEETASVGGTVSTDASGSDSFMYGSTRRWVTALEAVLPDGRVMKLRRGAHLFRGLQCTHPQLGTLQLPNLSIKQPVKNAAGYFIRRDMDLIDLFIGSEGTLGLITNVELKLAPASEHIMDIVVFPENGESFWELFKGLRNSRDLSLRALEMMNTDCLDFLRRHPDEVPPIPENAAFALIARIEAEDDDALDGSMEALDGLMAGCGIPPDAVMGGFEPSERKRIKDFRHYLPEAVNRFITLQREKSPGIHKFGSDGAVSPELLPEYYANVLEILKERKLESVIFGHAGQGHLHANALPASHEQMKAAEEAMERIAALSVKMGGTVSAEHGLGRLKLKYLPLMYSEDDIRGMEGLRRTVDPKGLLASAMKFHV